MLKRKMKLGSVVKLIRTIKNNSNSIYLEGTIGVVCDIDNPQFPYVELKNSKGLDGFDCFDANDLQLIEE